ncbi:MAG TPA: hypothetical protein VN259_09825 [Xanthomonadales bacterium]|nr:hypothetical protein [Xanthomonadales bacterium]
MSRSTKGLEMLAQDRYVLVDGTRLQALRDAVDSLLEGIEDPQDELAQTARQALRALQTKPALTALRWVRGDLENRTDSALMIVPPGVGDDQAAQALKDAVRFAAAATADGQTGTYFEALQTELGRQTGAIITDDVHHLSTDVAWDECVFPDEPEGLPDEGDEEWARVRFTNPDDLSALDGEISDGELLDGSGVVQLQAGAGAFMGFVTSITYRYPRAEKYGVPSAATDDGAREFIVKGLGFACSGDLEIIAQDTGDDSVESFEIECTVPRSVLSPVAGQRPGER